MVNQRKNETERQFSLLEFIKTNRSYSEKWTVDKQSNKYIQEILDKTSKANTDNKGFPDLIYVNESKKLLIMVEVKSQVKDHVSKSGNKPKDFAVDGIRHYLSFFIESKLRKEKSTIQNHLKNWKIIGIAFSGDINSEYGHQVDSFIIEGDNIKNINEKDILDEDDYIAYFENIDLEKIASDISKSSSEINILLRSLDSQKRPILLSALMICLYPSKDIKDFKNSYSSWDNETIIANIPNTVERVLKKEGVDKNKIKVLINELIFIETDSDLNSTDILKDILKELEENVIPLFYTNTSYDIIGKFYEEFLRYAGVTNVKKGIILTPNHITKLFTELIDIKTNDIIFDSCCGTGTFLIAGMKKLIETIEQSSLANKKEKISSIKEKQLIGFEKSSTMYSLAISNMLFRGDGKSRIFNVDFFNKEANKILKGLEKQPTIGFINPPYGGRDNKKKNPTKKEIQFLQRMLDKCSRYVIIIAPLSTYFKDVTIREKLLAKHTLKYVINMPSDLFQPNAFTHTAIAVFETHSPHSCKEVVFYDLKDDGFILSKNKGRTDVLNKWNGIKKDTLEKISRPREYGDSINLIFKEISGKEEWIIQAHAKTDYSNLTMESFEKSIKKYVIFQAKLKLDLINRDIDEITLLEIFTKNNIRADSILRKKTEHSKFNLLLNEIEFKEFNLSDIFEITRGERLIELDRIPGNVLYFSASEFNNGYTDAISNPLFVESNAIIYTTFGDAYYVNGDFTASDEISIFKNPKLNVYNSLFLTTIISKNKYKYSFGRKAFRNKFINDIISIPVTSQGAPDWQFMEDYIKSLPYSSNLE